MYSVQNSVHSTEIQEEQQPQQRMKLGDYIPVYIPAIEVGLMNQSEKKPRFLDFLKARPSNDWFLKILLRNPNPTTTPTPPTTGFRVPFVRKINLKRFWKFFKKWIKSPEHFAVFIWLLFVAGGLVLLFLVMTGILNSAIPNSDRRKDWIEIINQILNALFTMMAIYEHPKFFHHLILLLRYKPADQIILRKVYTKNGVPKPNERRHMLFVVALLHITCIAQYVYCGLYWGYTRKTRPGWAENLSIGVGIGAPVVAILYTIYSVLGRVNDEPEEDEELENQHDQQQQIETIDQKIIITTPEWIGGLFDCGDDTTVSCLSFFCTFCVFGWNMERLGFGNMYVHIITFILFCTAPFWIFAISALNVHDDTIPLILVITGSVLCIFGLLYGGFWRSKMRKKFKLPGTYSCCGSTGIADYLRWLFCWSCALAQEVRTANFYDIEDNGFYRTVTDADGRSVLVPLPREGTLVLSNSYERSRSMPVTPRSVDSDGLGSVGGFGRAMTCPKIPWTRPPSPVLMRVEEERPLRMVEGSD